VALLYEQPALKAVRFLQALYGFVIANYNYESMVGYRSLARSSALLVAAAVRSKEPLASATGLGAAVQPCPTVDLQVFCSQLVASVHKVYWCWWFLPICSLSFLVIIHFGLINKSLFLLL
jgi:hypothetical protein